MSNIYLASSKCYLRRFMTGISILFMVFLFLSWILCLFDGACHNIQTLQTLYEKDMVNTFFLVKIIIKIQHF